MSQMWNSSSYRRRRSTGYQGRKRRRTVARRTSQAVQSSYRRPSIPPDLVANTRGFSMDRMNSGAEWKYIDQFANPAGAPYTTIQYYLLNAIFSFLFLGFY